MTISATTQGIKPGVCLSTAKPSVPFDGQVIYMTDVDQTAVWDGTQWTVLAPIASGRNKIINGDFKVWQHGSSFAAPTGSGFRNSLKMLCTTADASPAAADIMIINQRFEGQNIQQFLKGTASAKQFALTFWVKSNVTGTYIAELHDQDNSRSVSASYTVSVSATWEKKTIIFPADTSGVLDNDNALSLVVNFWLGAGTNYTSGTLATTWGTHTNANRVVGQTNLAAATNNYWQITGVQLEAGAVATPFEFEDISTTLTKCKRYYHREGDTNYHYYMPLTDWSAGNSYGSFRMPVEMRTIPTLSYSSISDFRVYASVTVGTPTSMSEWVPGASSGKLHIAVNVLAPNLTGGNKSGWFTNGGSGGWIGFSAEL